MYWYCLPSVALRGCHNADDCDIVICASILSERDQMCFDTLLPYFSGRTTGQKFGVVFLRMAPNVYKCWQTLSVHCKRWQTQSAPHLATLDVHLAWQPYLCYTSGNPNWARHLATLFALHIWKP
jgi:hypothetical protein